MLRHLSISNLAIIERLEVSFGPGLNIISGETGTGKSIILGAVGLLMGAKAQPGLVRDGAEEAVVEGLFEAPLSGELAEALGQAGLEAGPEVILARAVAAEGRSRAYLNSRLVNLALLRDMGSRLLSVSGQHESQRLTREEEHLLLLDSFAGLEELRARAAGAYAKLNALQRDLVRLRELEQDRGQRIELLTYQLQEIEAARLGPDEEEELEAEAQRLKHAERLNQGAHEIHQALYADDRSLASLLGLNRAELEKLARLDPGLTDLSARLEEAGHLLEDAARELGDYADRIVFDPERQAEVEERLALIRRLLRKYAPGAGAAGVLARAEEMAGQLDGLRDMDLALGRLQKETARAEEELESLAGELSRERARASERLSRAVVGELEGLGLEGSRFEVSLAKRAGAIGPDGFDEVSFGLSANPGEPLRPLARVASGGELSRLTLALKSILARQGEVESVIFDEVDAGIGGRVAEVVGRKLRALGQRHQVLCITHLPQIAAFGQKHFRVVKEVAAGRTVSRIEPLAPEERIEELARMLAGAKLTEKALAHAREMLAQAESMGS